MHASLRNLMVFGTAFRLVSFMSVVPFVEAAPANTAISQERVVSADLSPEHFLQLTNLARTAAGVPPLTLNAELDNAASAKDADMVAMGYWEHFRPSDGKAPWDFIHEAGYHYAVAGENLARGYETSNGITEAWLKSPAHAANLLSAKYTEVGFACVRTTGPDGQPVLMTVQMFGSR